MALPPLEAGAVQVRLTEPLPATAPVMVGAPGVVDGVTASEGLDGAEVGVVGSELVVVTVNVYEVPFVSGLTVADKVNPSGVIAVTPLGFDVTV
jgi:hypothetical protein